MRKFGQQVIEGLAGERVHPSWTVPGGVNAALEVAGRDRILAALPQAKAIALRTLGLFKGIVDQFAEEISVFGNAPTMYAGLVDDQGNLQLYDAMCGSSMRRVAWSLIGWRRRTIRSTSARRRCRIRS